MADDIFYVDCTIQLHVNSNNLENNLDAIWKLNTGGNFVQTYIGSAGVKTSDENTDDTTTGNNGNNKNNDEFGDVSMLLFVAIDVIVLLLLAPGGLIHYFTIHKMKKQNVMRSGILGISKW